MLRFATSQRSQTVRSFFIVLNACRPTHADGTLSYCEDISSLAALSSASNFSGKMVGRRPDSAYVEETEAQSRSHRAAQVVACRIDIRHGDMAFPVTSVQSGPKSGVDVLGKLHQARDHMNDRHGSRADAESRLKRQGSPSSELL